VAWSKHYPETFLGAYRLDRTSVRIFRIPAEIRTRIVTPNYSVSRGGVAPHILNLILALHAGKYWAFATRQLCVREIFPRARWALAVWDLATVWAGVVENISALARNLTTGPLSFSL
jgi:hypothetical protein